MKSVCEFYFEDNFVLHQFAFTKALLLTKFNKIKKITMKNYMKLI